MIYTFGDGFAAGHIWPEWPQILEAITQMPVTNFGHIGAGNEYIFNCAVKTALKAQPTDTFLIQWAKPDRFDKIIEDAAWEDLQSQDPVYKSIQSNVYNQTWWSTSASNLEQISTYRNFYIQSQQATDRSVLYMISLSKMLDSFGIKHYYFCTYNYDYSSHINFKDLKKLPWIDMVGMDEWSRHMELRGTEIQPKPIIHFNWVIEKILPRLNIELPPLVIDNISNVIKNYNFEPFHFDRDQEWTNIKNEISLLLK